MVSKAERNLYLNIALLFFGAISVGTGVLLSLKLPVLLPLLRTIPIKPMHEWASYILTGLVLIHLSFHFGGMKALIKTKFSRK